MLADGTTHEDLDATLRQLAKGGLAAFRTRRVVELVGMLTVLAAWRYEYISRYSYISYSIVKYIYI